jgi:chemotaxis protein CheD
MVEARDTALARNTYYDRSLEKPAAKLLPGEYYVTAEDMVLVTVLGSCVAACIRDTVSGIGGMNHFMLPDGTSDVDGSGASARYGVFAMELLINSLLKMGARKHNFEAKVFGGGNVMKSLNHSVVGKRNAEFVLEFLAAERIRVAAKDLEDIYPRKVYFFPHSGMVRVKKITVAHNSTIYERESDYGTRITRLDRGGEVELFS